MSELVPEWVKEIVAEEIREEEEAQRFDACSILEEMLRWVDRRQPFKDGEPWWVTKARDILKRERPWRTPEVPAEDAPERPWDTLHTGPGMPDLRVVTGDEEGFLVRIYAENGTFEELRVKPKGEE